MTEHSHLFEVPEMPGTSYRRAQLIPENFDEALKALMRRPLAELEGLHVGFAVKAADDGLLHIVDGSCWHSLEATSGKTRHVSAEEIMKGRERLCSACNGDRDLWRYDSLVGIAKFAAELNAVEDMLVEASDGEPFLAAAYLQRQFSSHAPEHTAWMNRALKNIAESDDGKTFKAKYEPLFAAYLHMEGNQPPAHLSLQGFEAAAELHSSMLKRTGDILDSTSNVALVRIKLPGGTRASASKTLQYGLCKLFYRVADEVYQVPLKVVPWLLEQNRHEVAVLDEALHPDQLENFKALFKPSRNPGYGSLEDSDDSGSYHDLGAAAQAAIRL